MPDWEKMKDEYVHSSISLRGLADKFGATARRVSYRAKQEGWYAEKQRQIAQKDKRYKSIGSESGNDAAELGASDIRVLTDKLYKKANFAIDALDDSAVDTQQLRRLVQSVKDLKELVHPEDEAKDAGRLEELVKGLCKA